MSTRARRVLMTTEGASSFVRDVDALAGVEARARYDLGDSRDAQALIEGLDGCFAVIAGSEPYTREVLGRAGDLRAIVRWGSGCDAIDLQAATEHGIAVVSVPGANAEPVADMALALMLAVLRGIPRLDRDVRAGDWRASWLGGDLAGASVGIVGLGAIGRAVARRAHGFGCRLMAVEPYPDHAFCAEHGISLLQLDEMLPRVDVLSLHCALTASTGGLIGARELGLMRPTAVLINTSRGPLVDQAALVRALREGRLAGAGLDVFEQEPPSRSEPLLELENVVLTPHAAAFTGLAAEMTGKAVLAALRDLLEGRLPASCLNSHAWES